MKCFFLPKIKPPRINERGNFSVSTYIFIRIANSEYMIIKSIADAISIEILSNR